LVHDALYHAQPFTSWGPRDGKCSLLVNRTWLRRSNCDMWFYRVSAFEV
jgi:hypothetical protein